MDINVGGNLTVGQDFVVGDKYVTNITNIEQGTSHQAVVSYLENRQAEHHKPETTNQYIPLLFEIYANHTKDRWFSTDITEVGSSSFLILGEIGGGKSTVLRKLALKAFQNQEAHKKLPIFLDLSTWPDGQEFEIFVKEYLKVHLGYELLFPCTQWVLFLDSLNEMSGDVTAKINQLKEFLETYNIGRTNGVQAIIACQYKSYLNYGKPFSLPYTLIQELTEEQIGQYIGGKNKSIQTLLSRKFIKTPFQLTIINRLLQENSETDFEVYENFSQVFEAYINQVLMNQKNPKKYYYASYVPEIEVIKNGLGQLAFDIQESQEGSTVTAGFALKSVSKFFAIKAQPNSTSHSVLQQAQNQPHIFLLRIAEKADLVRIDEKDLTIQFTHEFYQKYFTAYFMSTKWAKYIKELPQLYLGRSHLVRYETIKWELGELREPQTWDEVWFVMASLLNRAELYNFLQFVTNYDPVLAVEIIKKADIKIYNTIFIEKQLWQFLEAEQKNCDLGCIIYALGNFPTDATIKKLTQLLCEKEYHESIISRSLWQIGQTIGITTLLQKMHLTQKPDDQIIWGLLTHTPLEDDFINSFIFFDAQCFLKLDNYQLQELIHPWRTNNIQSFYIANANELAKLIKQNKKGVIEFLWIKEQPVGEAWEYLLELVINSDKLIDSSIIHIALAGIFTNPYINSEKSTSYILSLLEYKNPLVQKTTVEFFHTNKTLPRYLYSPPVYELLIKQIEDNIYSNIPILSKLFDMWLSYFNPVDWDNKIHSKFDPQPTDRIPLVNSLHEAIYQALWEVSPNSLLEIIENKIPYIIKQGYDIGVVLHLLDHCRFVGSKERYSHINHKIHSNLCNWLINIYSLNSSASISYALTIIKPPSALSIFIKKAEQGHYRCILALAEMDLGERKNEVIQLLYTLARQKSDGAIKALVKLGEDITEDLMDSTDLVIKDFKKFSFSLIPELLGAYENLNKASPKAIEGLQNLIRVAPFKGGMNGEDHILSIVKLLDKLAPENAWSEIFILLERFYETAQSNDFEFLDVAQAISFILEYISNSNKTVTKQQKDLLVNIGEVIYTFYLWEREKRYKTEYYDALSYVINILGVQKIEQAVPLLQKILENSCTNLQLQQPTIKALGEFKNILTTKILCQIYTLRDDYVETENTPRKNYYNGPDHDKVAGWVTEQLVEWGTAEAFEILFNILSQTFKISRGFWQDYFLTDIYQVIRTIHQPAVLTHLIGEWGKITSPILSAHVAEGCFPHMPQAVPYLIEFLKQNSPNRLQMIQLLIYIHKQAVTFEKEIDVQQIFNALAKLNKDPDTDVRQEVNLYLGRYQDVRAIDGLTDMILHPNPPASFIKSRPGPDDDSKTPAEVYWQREFQGYCMDRLIGINSPKVKEVLQSFTQNSDPNIKYLGQEGLKALKKEEKQQIFIPPLATS